MGKYEPNWEDVQKDIAKRIDELFQLREEKKNKKKEEHKKAVARYNRRIYLTVKKIRKKIGIIFR